MDVILAEQGESMRCIFVDTALNENTEWRACRDLERDDRPVVIDSLRWRHGNCEQGSFLDSSLLRPREYARESMSRRYS